MLGNSGGSPGLGGMSSLLGNNSRNNNRGNSYNNSRNNNRINNFGNMYGNNNRGNSYNNSRNNNRGSSYNNNRLRMRIRRMPAVTVGVQNFTAPRINRAEMEAAERMDYRIGLRGLRFPQ